MKKKAMWLIAAGVFAADRVTKILTGGIPPEGIPLIPGIVRLRYAENTGAAFSMFSGYPWLLGVLSLLIIAGAFLFMGKQNIPALAMTGLMVMLGGAVGSMADRFATGFVPDMIELLFVRFAIFNVADSFLCIGCALTAVSLLRRTQ